MKCPYCNTIEDKVIDSRISRDGETIRRRRECLSCQKRFTTHEIIEDTMPAIIKKDSRRETYDRKKILEGLKKACQKRDISIDKLEEITDRIERSLLERGLKEIPSTDIGEKVMQELHELDAAARLARHYRVERHILLPLDLRAFGGSALTADIAVPKGGVEPGIPVTYVPARNSIFLSVALGWAEAAGGSDIVIGVNALDYSGYPDCRPEFVDAFEKLANTATKLASEKRFPIRIHAPLLHLDKKQTILLGLSLGVDYSLTHTCYDPSPEGLACGDCDACTLRRRGFEAAGVPDPTRYARR